MASQAITMSEQESACDVQVAQQKTEQGASTHVEAQPETVGADDMCSPTKSGRPGQPQMANTPDTELEYPEEWDADVEQDKHKSKQSKSARAKAQRTCKNPLDPKSIWEHTKDCPDKRCVGCKKLHTTWTQLVKHYEQSHAVKKASMQGSYIHSQHLIERNGGLVMSDLEAQYVDVDPDNDKQFICRACTPPISLSKYSVVSHMVGHKVDEKVIKTWLVWQDRTSMKNHAKNIARVRQAIELREQPQQVDDDVAAPEQKPAESNTLVQSTGQHEETLCGKDAQQKPEMGNTKTSQAQVGSQLQSIQPMDEPKQEPEPLSQQEKQDPTCDVGANSTNSIESQGSQGGSPHVTPSPAPNAEFVSTSPHPAVQVQESNPAMQQFISLLNDVKKGLSKDPEVAWPAKMELKPVIKEWIGTDDFGEKYPFQYTLLDHPAYFKYLEDTLGESTRAGRAMHIGRLFSALLVPAVDANAAEPFCQLGEHCAQWSPLQLLIGMQKHRIADELKGTHLFAHSKNWTTKLLTGLDCLIEYEKKVCRSKGFDQCEKVLCRLQDDLEAYHYKSYQAKNAAGKARNRKDAQRIKAMPDNDNIKLSCRDAMIMLHLLSQRWSGKSRAQIPVKEKALANTLLIGIIHLNGHAGRSGEWEHMLAEHVDTQLGKGLDYLICTKYKTSETYGELAKYLAPGTVAAIQVYKKLPPGSSDKFLKPAVEEVDQVSISHYLRRFGEIFWQKYQHPTSNLLRKKLHVELKKQCRDERVLKLLSVIDAHSQGVAEAVYCVKDPADDAELAKAAFKQAMGPPVEWPSEDIIKEEGSTMYKKMMVLLSKPDSSFKEPQPGEDNIDSDTEPAGKEYTELFVGYKMWLQGKALDPVLGWDSDLEGPLPLADAPTTNTKNDSAGSGTPLQDGTSQSADKASDALAPITDDMDSESWPEQLTSSQEHKKESKSGHKEKHPSKKEKKDKKHKHRSSKTKQELRATKLDMVLRNDIESDISLDDISDIAPYQPVPGQKNPIEDAWAQWAIAKCEFHRQKHSSRPTTSWIRTRLWAAGVKRKMWYRFTNPDGLRNRITQYYKEFNPDLVKKKQCL